MEMICGDVGKGFKNPVKEISGLEEIA